MNKSENGVDGIRNRDGLAVSRLPSDAGDLGIADTESREGVVHSGQKQRDNPGSIPQYDGSEAQVCTSSQVLVERAMVERYHLVQQSRP